MKQVEFTRPGKTVEDLEKCFEKIEKKYSSKISENDMTIGRNGNVITLSLVKKVLFMNYHLNANIFLDDGMIKIEYESNIPESFEKKAMDMIDKELSSECS